MPSVHTTTGQRSVATPATDLITRAAGLAPATLNAQARSVTTTIATEAPVPIYDWALDRIVMEVLTVAGASYDDQTPLLRDHSQWSVTAVLGSVTDVRVEGDELVGVTTFGEDLDDQSEGIWRRVQQGHLRRVSVGYTYGRDDYTTIPAGRTQVVGGRDYTAPQSRDLRVVTRWHLREVSVVVIPADRRAKMRHSGSGGGTPPPKIDDSVSPPPHPAPHTPPITSPRGDHPVHPIIQYLRGHGLPADITTPSAAIDWARGNLPAGAVAGLRAVADAHSVTVDYSGFRTGDPPTPPTPAPSPADPPTPAPSPAPSPGESPDAIRAAAVAAERDRCQQIRGLANGLPQVTPDVINRCIDEGMTVDAARAAVLEAIRQTPPGPVPPTPPAGHTRGGITLATIQAALLAREGITPDSPVLRSAQAQTITSPLSGFRCEWLAGAAREGQSRDAVEQEFDRVRHTGLHHASLMRLCEAIIEASGERRSSYSVEENLRTAFSLGDFSAVFGAVTHMSMMAGYLAVPATYEQFCRVTDVADFRDHTDFMATGVGGLKKQGKPGAAAALMNIESPILAKYAAERYAGQLRISEQTIINDSFGVTGQLPSQVGAAARQIPNDLAFAILLSNPTLSDSQALFLANVNMISDDLDGDGVAAARALMRNQKIGNTRIVVTEELLLHGPGKYKAVREAINAAVVGGTNNVMQGVARPVEDTAIDLGVTDPSTDPETVVAGLPGSVFLFGRPHSPLVVAFRSGTNRGPVSRSGQLPLGEFGLVYDIVIDVGAAATGRRGAVRINT